MKSEFVSWKPALLSCRRNWILIGNVSQLGIWLREFFFIVSDEVWKRAIDFSSKGEQITCSVGILDWQALNIIDFFPVSGRPLGVAERILVADFLHLHQTSPVFRALARSDSFIADLKINFFLWFLLGSTWPSYLPAKISFTGRFESRLVKNNWNSRYIARCHCA